MDKRNEEWSLSWRKRQQKHLRLEYEVLAQDIERKLVVMSPTGGQLDSAVAAMARKKAEVDKTARKGRQAYGIISEVGKGEV